MNAAVVFDLIVGSVFLIAAIAGLLLGFKKLFLIVLAWELPGLLVVLLWFGIKPLLGPLPWPDASILLYIGIITRVLAVILIIVIIALIPSPRSAAGRWSGFVLAMALATLTVAVGGAVAAQIADMEQVRKNSITGPAVFAAGDALVSLLPDNPDDLFKKRERPKQ